MRSWPEQFEESWLGSPGVVGRVDGQVRKWLGMHRGLSGAALQSIAPLSVRTLVADIRAFGSENRWAWCSAGISLLSELIFAAESGGAFNSGRYSGELAEATEPLNLVRNAVCHPAHHSSDESGEPHISRLIRWMRSNGEAELAQALHADWAVLASRPVAEFGLRKLNHAGERFAILKGIAPASDFPRRRR